MKTILLIDDDDSLRHSFAQALHHHGYQVLQASTSSDGMAMARKHLPDLILSDVNMPGGSGQDLLTAIRKDPELSARQVVLMTGDGSSVTPRRGMELGADDFLVKPVRLAELLQCVDARIQRAQLHWRVEDRMLTQLRSSLHSTMPHEFFTPLAGIIGLADLLLCDDATFAPSEQKELHRDIQQSALRLHRTLRNYLETIELDAKSAQVAVEPELLSPGEVLQSIGVAVNTVLDRTNRNEDLSTELASVAVRVTPADLTLIVEEMADNGCKFSRKGTPVVIRLDVSGVLSVTDTGRGMAPEEIKTIGAFQQFNRGKNEQQGLGLGLVLVQKLAARCGAEFSIASTLSMGTEVKVAFKTA
jgi:two-component system sensor histidine kinase/response regulator